MVVVVVVVSYSCADILLLLLLLPDAAKKTRSSLGEPVWIDGVTTPARCARLSLEVPRIHLSPGSKAPNAGMHAGTLV